MNTKLKSDQQNRLYAIFISLVMISSTVIAVVAHIPA